MIRAIMPTFWAVRNPCPRVTSTTSDSTTRAGRRWRKRKGQKVIQSYAAGHYNLAVEHIKTLPPTCSKEVSISGLFCCWLLYTEVVTEVPQYHRLAHQSTYLMRWGEGERWSCFAVHISRNFIVLPSLPLPTLSPDLQEEQYSLQQYSPP